MTKEHAALENENNRLRLELTLLIGEDFAQREISRLRHDNARLRLRIDAERRMLAEMYGRNL